MLLATVEGEEEIDMTPIRRGGWMLVAAIFAGGLIAGCEEGPLERAGEKVDKAVDKLSGKGPAEKAGERLDEAARELTKK
jgi:hypothetical protein